MPEGDRKGFWTPARRCYASSVAGGSQNDEYENTFFDKEGVAGNRRGGKTRAGGKQGISGAFKKCRAGKIWF